MASQNMMKYCEKYKNTAKLLTVVFQRLMTLISNFFVYVMYTINRDIEGSTNQIYSSSFKIQNSMNINRRTLFFIINSRITEIGQHHLLFFVTNLLVNVIFYLSKLGPNFVAGARTKENDYVKTKVPSLICSKI